MKIKPELYFVFFVVQHILTLLHLLRTSFANIKGVYSFAEDMSKVYVSEDPAGAATVPSGTTADKEKGEVEQNDLVTTPSSFSRPKLLKKNTLNQFDDVRRLRATRYVYTKRS